METCHRETLRRNHSDLMSNCNFRNLLPKLVEKNVFSWEMAKLYEKCDERSKRNLLFDLSGRGPRAFDGFVTSLKEIGQHSLANKLLGLEESTLPATRDHATPFLLPSLSYEDHIPVANLRTEPLRIRVAHSTVFRDDFRSQLTPYSMRSKTRGAVLVINNKNFDRKPRNGSHMDEVNLMALFHQMGGYDVTLRVDLDTASLQKAVRDFAESPKLKSVDVMFVIIMSHGRELGAKSVVECIDGGVVPTELIESQFYGDRCPSMQNKPKIIIYQICRGSYEDHGVSPVETDGHSGAPVRTHADMLICHSTPHGYRAHRDREFGSWYIQFICENFMKYAHEYHVEDLLRMVDECLRELQADNWGRTMQTANFHNTGFRVCYLNPGIYEEEEQLCRYDVT